MLLTLAINSISIVKFFIVIIINMNKRGTVTVPDDNASIMLLLNLLYLHSLILLLV